MKEQNSAFYTLEEAFEKLNWLPGQNSDGTDSYRPICKKCEINVNAGTMMIIQRTIAFCPNCKISMQRSELNEDEKAWTISPIDDEFIKAITL